MGARECSEAFKRVTGSAPPPGKVAELQNDIGRRQQFLSRSVKDWDKLTPTERKIAAVDAIVKETKAKQLKAKNNVIRNALIKQDAIDQLNTLAEVSGNPKNASNVAANLLDQWKARFDTAVRNGFSDAHVRLSRAAGVDDLFKKDGFFGWVSEPVNMAKFARELDGHKTGDANAKAAAQAWREITDELVTKLNRAGADVGKLDYAYLPTLHDRGKIAKPENEAAWLEDALRYAKTKPGYYVNEDGSQLSDEALTKLLKTFRTSIITRGTAGKSALDLAQGANSPGGAASLGNKHREFHMDAASSIEYASKWGKGTPYDMIMGYVQRMSHDTAMYSQLGTNPAATFNVVKAWARKKNNGEDKRTGFLRGGTSLDHIWAEVSGQTSNVVSEFWADATSTFNNLQVSSKLGKAFWAGLADFSTMFTTARYNKLPVWELFKQIPKVLTKKHREEMAMEGMIAESLMGAGQSRFVLDDGPRDWSAKAARFTMRASMLNALTEGVRDASMRVHMYGMSDLVKKSWDELDEGDRARLQRAGFTDGDWQVLQKAQIDTVRGEIPMLTPRALNALGEAEFASSVQGRIDTMTADATAAAEALFKRNAQEETWIAGREEKLGELRDRLTERVAKLSEVRGKKNAEAIQDLKDRIDLLEIESSAAKVRTEVERIEATEDFAITKRFQHYFKQRRAPDSGLKPFGRARTVAGEAAGFKQRALIAQAGDLKRRIRERETRLNQANDADLTALHKRLHQASEEMNAFIERSEKRQMTRQLGAEAIGKRLEKMVAEETLNAKDALLNKYQAFLMDESHYASIASSATSKAFFNRGTSRGTPEGNLARLFSLFNGFPVAIMTRHWIRALEQKKVGDRLSYLGMMFLGNTLLGMVSVQTRNLLLGNDVEEFSGKFVAKSILLGGAAGWYLDTLNYLTGILRKDYKGEADQAGVLGAGIGLANDLLNPVRAMFDERKDNVAPELFKLAYSNIPGGNLWYADKLMKTIIYDNMMEFISPGSAKRSRAHLEAQNVTQWWQTGEALPERAPNVNIFK